MLVDYIRVYQQKDQENVTTGIRHLSAEDRDTDNGWYNLMGQRVGNDECGLLIHHGKKIVRPN